MPATTRSPTPRGDRPRLAGDHRLVELGARRRRCGRRPAPGRRGGPARRRRRAGRDAAPSRRSPSPSTRSASSGSSSASAASAPWAWPIAFISCQWPSSMIVTSAASSHQKSRSNQPEAGRHRGDERDRDGHRDQQHHPGLRGRGPRATAPAGTATRRRRTPPCRAPAPTQSTPRESIVPEPVHHHRAGDHDRDGQRQAQPELPPEHLRVVPGVLVMPVLPRVVVMPTVVVSGPGVTTGVVAGSMPGGGSRPVTGVGCGQHVPYRTAPLPVPGEAAIPTPSGRHRPPLGGPAEDLATWLTGR